MYLSSYRKIRKVFKAQRGESAASYFERLSNWLEIKPSWDDVDDYEAPPK